MFVFQLRLRRYSLKTWFLNTPTVFSGDENFLMCGNKEKSLVAKSGLYGGWPINSTFWPVNKVLIWADVWELALSCWTMIQPSLVRFLKFSEDFRQTNCGVPLRTDRSKMLKWNSRPWPVFTKKQAVNEVIFPQTAFVGFGSSSKDPPQLVHYYIVSGSNA